MGRKGRETTGGEGSEGGRRNWKGVREEWEE